MLGMTFPNLESYEIAKELAEELGIQYKIKIGPSDESLEGLRLVSFHGLPDRLIMMSDLFAIRLMMAQKERAQNIRDLKKMWSMTT
jgi:hypothetical protein